MIYEIMLNFIDRVGLIIVLAFLTSRIKIFRELVLKDKISNLDKIKLGIFFGVFGIIGTYTGIPVKGAIINSRVIGVFVGGLLGGPFVGGIAGAIAGIHRWAIDIGGFTALSCAVSTISEGLLAGFLSRYMYKKNQKWIFALLGGIIAEIIQMAIILLMAKPFEEALNLVSIIAIPMIIGNSIGISVFIAITESIFGDYEKSAAIQASLVLKIADKTLKHLRKGLNQNSALETSKIIYDIAELKAVAITDKNIILAHVGEGEKHHKSGLPINTELTKKVLKEGNYAIANKKELINCKNKSCKLRSAVIVPLKEKENVIGTLKLYRVRENAITQVDIELALGLASLFSTQIELSKLEYQKELLANSELKALQSQINPHFLFNAINTIVSFIRINPDKARELLITLGDYFRKNLSHQVGDISIHKEIEHVNSYVEIEKARFGKKLSVIIEIEENIEFELPPLILQPLVENAIKHGILKKIEGGTVKVSIKENEVDYIITVEDDGVGIEEERLKELLCEKEDKNSIGLLNIHKRLINKYGEEYGLDIFSDLEVTRVEMKIPK